MIPLINIEPISRQSTPVDFSQLLEGAAVTRKSGKRATILIADDDPIMLELTAVSLARSGYDVMTAKDGDAALQAFKNSPGPIQLVISDGAMPGLNGPQLLRAVKTLSPSTATLLVSGTVASSDTETPLLMKPFRPKKLAALVRELLTGCDFDRVEREQSVARSALSRVAASGAASGDSKAADQDVLDAIAHSRPCPPQTPTDS
jgi:DNA-binding response OmpR family regulator